jgi:uncharacterized protein (TIGR03000 family)
MMSRQLFSCLMVAALAVAALLAAADPASAQGRRSTSFGVSPGGGFYYGQGYPGYGRGYYGPWEGSYGRGYPGYYGYGWNTPGYRWSDYNWGTPYYYSGNNPSYYSQGMEGNYYTETPGAGQSYGTSAGADIENQVMIGVRVPANAEVWFEDQKTSQTGNVRNFVSPPLQSDQKYTYHIRARWTENGRQVEKDRKLEVHPGDRLFVNFMRPSSETRGTATGEYGAVGAEPEIRDTQRTRQENANRLQDNKSQQRPPQPQSETPRSPDKP